MKDDKKNPFSDEVEITDIENLVTGSGSFMFDNENLVQKNKRAQKLAKEAEAKKAKAGVIVPQDLLVVLAGYEAENRDIGGYLDDIYAKNGKPKIKAEDVEVEFRARQMNLKLIKDLRSWTLSQTRK